MCRPVTNDNAEISGATDRCSATAPRHVQHNRQPTARRHKAAESRDRRELTSDSRLTSLHLEAPDPAISRPFDPRLRPLSSQAAVWNVVMFCQIRSGEPFPSRSPTPTMPRGVGHSVR